MRKCSHWTLARVSLRSIDPIKIFMKYGNKKHILRFLLWLSKKSCNPLTKVSVYTHMQMIRIYFNTFSCCRCSVCVNILHILCQYLNSLATLRLCLVPSHVLFVFSFLQKHWSLSFKRKFLSVLHKRHQRYSF